MAEKILQWLLREQWRFFIYQMINTARKEE